MPGINVTLGNVIALTKIIEKTLISVKLSLSAISIIMVPSNQWKKGKLLKWIDLTMILLVVDSIQYNLGKKL